MLALHAADAAAHDYVAGEAGSFAAALTAFAAARGQAVRTLVHRSNYRVLSAIPPLLEQRGVASWHLSIWRGAGEPHQVPRLAMAMSFVLHAVSRAEALGLEVILDGAPHCLLGPFVSRAAGEVRAHPAPCLACSARAVCPGVDAAYVERFGTAELTPRP